MIFSGWFEKLGGGSFPATNLRVEKEGGEMLSKVICFILGHSWWFPADEKYRTLLGGVCMRCLKLTDLPKLDNKIGSTIVWNRLD